MDINLNSKIYPQEAILNVCYTFIDRTYIFLDSGPKRESIRVSLKPKNRASQKQLETLKGEFMNELLHFALRYMVSKNNKKIREFIVERALYSVLTSPFSEDLQAKEMKKTDYQDDPFGIAVPWEEKHGKEKKNARIKV